MSQRRAMRVVGRMVSPAGLSLLRLWTRLTNQQRARIVVVTREGEVLLIKTVIGHDAWSLVGGGIDRGESPEQAVRRELEEETGISLEHMPVENLLFFEKHTIPNVTYDAHILFALIDKKPANPLPIRRYEVLEYGWFLLDDLPSPLSQMAEIALQKLPQRR